MQWSFGIKIQWNNNVYLATVAGRTTVLNPEITNIDGTVFVAFNTALPSIGYETYILSGSSPVLKGIYGFQQSIVNSWGNFLSKELPGYYYNMDSTEKYSTYTYNGSSNFSLSGTEYNFDPQVTVGIFSDDGKKMFGKTLG